MPSGWRGSAPIGRARAGAAGDSLCRPERAACRPRALVRAGDDRCDRPRGDGARYDRAASGRGERERRCPGGRLCRGPGWRSSVPIPSSGAPWPMPARRSAIPPSRRPTGRRPRRPARRSGTCPCSSPTGRAPWPGARGSVPWSSLLGFASRALVGQARRRGRRPAWSSPTTCSTWATSSPASRRRWRTGTRGPAAAGVRAAPGRGRGQRRTRTPTGRRWPAQARVPRMKMSGRRRTVHGPRSRRA